METKDVRVRGLINGFLNKKIGSDTTMSNRYFNAFYEQNFSTCEKASFSDFVW